MGGSAGRLGRRVRPGCARRARAAPPSRPTPWPRRRRAWVRSYPCRRALPPPAARGRDVGRHEQSVAGARQHRAPQVDRLRQRVVGPLHSHEAVVHEAWLAAGRRYRRPAVFWVAEVPQPGGGVGGV
eukprot:scaffold28677_cov112-Isochrysis_galbana.AAC.6